MKNIGWLSIFIGIVFISCQQDDGILYPILDKNEDFSIINIAFPDPNHNSIKTSFKNPLVLKDYGFNYNVTLGNNIFVGALTNLKGIDPSVSNNEELNSWIKQNADVLQMEIIENKSKGIKCIARTDILLMPKQIYDNNKDLITENGKISINKPLVQDIVRESINEIFDKFDLDGLIIRTGELYLNRLPFHYGQNIIHQSNDYITLINILKEEICVKRNKLLIFRTWGFDGFHTSRSKYLEITDKIAPHKNLFFSIKHTSGDFFRTYGFNETIGIGNHKQIVEFQSQREYEGKGSHPNYIVKGVLTGFSEVSSNLSKFISQGKIAGIYIWSRGGGWAGPIIDNELWCSLNTYVISQYISNKGLKSEEELFTDFCSSIGITDVNSVTNFRELCLLSEEAVLLGQYSKIYPINVIWTRDHCFGGNDQLGDTFNDIINSNKIDQAIKEKETAVKLWEEIVSLSNKITSTNNETTEFIKISSQYGLLKYSIIKEGFTIMLLGHYGDINGRYRINEIKNAINAYDNAWELYKLLKENNSSCPGLYHPYSFKYDVNSDYLATVGMKSSVNKYRSIIKD